MPASVRGNRKSSMFPSLRGVPFVCFRSSSSFYYNIKRRDSYTPGRQRKCSAALYYCYRCKWLLVSKRSSGFEGSEYESEASEEGGYVGRDGLGRVGSGGASRKRQAGGGWALGKVVDVGVEGDAQHGWQVKASLRGAKAAVRADVAKLPRGLEGAAEEGIATRRRRGIFRPRCAKEGTALPAEALLEGRRERSRRPGHFVVLWRRPGLWGRAG